MLIYISIICTLVLVGVVFFVLVLCTLINILLKLKGDTEFLVEVLSKEYAKKVSDLMIENGFVAKKIDMTEEEARKLAKEFYSKEKKNGN